MNHNPIPLHMNDSFMEEECYTLLCDDINQKNLIRNSQNVFQNKNGGKKSINLQVQNVTDY